MQRTTLKCYVAYILSHKGTFVSMRSVERSTLKYIKSDFFYAKVLQTECLKMSKCFLSQSLKYAEPKCINRIFDKNKNTVCGRETEFTYKTVFFIFGENMASANPGNLPLPTPPPRVIFTVICYHILNNRSNDTSPYIKLKNNHKKNRKYDF